MAHIRWATIAAFLMMCLVASAQDVTGPVLKAAFIYNFAKFTEWPIDLLPASDPFVICVLGDESVREALVGAVKSRMLRSHSIVVSQMANAGSQVANAGPPVVSQVANAGPQQVCHILYVSGISAGQAARIVAGLRDVPVLTISDIDGFTQLGGIAQFFFENGQLRFSIHYDSAKRARLQISAKLLALGTRK